MSKPSASIIVSASEKVILKNPHSEEVVIGVKTTITVKGIGYQELGE